MTHKLTLILAKFLNMSNILTLGQQNDAMYFTYVPLIQNLLKCHSKVVAVTDNDTD